MKNLFIKIMLCVLCISLAHATKANPLPKKKLNKKQRLAKLFGFGKKTKNVALAPPVVPQRQAIKSDAQRKNLNMMASKLPSQQRTALFAKDRKEKYMIKAKSKAIARAQANKNRARQGQANMKNVAQGVNKAAPPKPARSNAAQPNNNPKSVYGPLPKLNSASNNTPSKNNPKSQYGPAPKLNTGATKSNLPPPVPPRSGIKTQGAPPPLPPRSNVGQNGNASKSQHGQTPVKNTLPPGQLHGKLPAAQHGTTPNKILPPGQKQGKIPSKSGVVYSKLPGKIAPAQKNTASNVKQQLRDKVGASSLSTKKKPLPPGQKHSQLPNTQQKAAAQQQVAQKKAAQQKAQQNVKKKATRSKGRN